MSDLQQRLHGLGLSQYHDAFVDEGFDTWDTLSDITEPDLDHLNVRLGHRRRLQRAIAESRGYGPDKALSGSLRRLSLDVSYNSDDSTGAGKDPSKLLASTQNSGGSGTKRKYRRHPKQDENAPERPASAYVIFSNQTREELKGQGLSFTEIAKLVGERWQVLDPTVREVFERQAGTVKEKYYADLASYKRTEDYPRYQEYLADFKARHGSHTGASSNIKQTRSYQLTAVTEGKRAKLETQTTNASLSTQSSRGESLERMQDMSGPHGVSDVIRRVASSPSTVHTQIGHLGHPMASAPLSPAASGYSLQSPTGREPYSPLPVANQATGYVPYDLPHHNRLHAGADGRIIDTSLPASALAASGPGAQTMREPLLRGPIRSRFDPLPNVPSLAYADTTLSSNGSISGVAPYVGSLLPVLDAPKDMRILPTPIAGAGLGSTPFGGRPRFAPPSLDSTAALSNDLANADGHFSALLRATELARETDLKGPKSPPPPSRGDNSR